MATPTDAPFEGGTEQTTREQVGSKVGELASEAQDKVGELAADTREAARGAQVKLRDKALTKADDQREQLVSQARELTKEGDKIAQQLRGDGLDRPAELVSGVSSQLEQLIGYVETTSVEQILQDAGSKAKQNPFTYIGAAFALGFATTRLLRADDDTAGSENMQLSDNWAGSSSAQQTQVLSSSGAGMAGRP